MCETGENCKRGNRFWVQTRRAVDVPANPAAGVEAFTTSGASTFSCGTCLPTAVRRIGEINDTAAKGRVDTARDGVVVKRLVSPDVWR
jgi:hypothetical protein